MGKQWNFKKNPTTKFRHIKKISRGDARKEIDALRKGINYHDYLYYVKNKPVISDARYDRLFHRLEELEAAFPEFKSDTSPTRRVGAPPVDKLEKKKHASLMLSLNATREEEKIRSFITLVKPHAKKQPVYVAEPKFDGFSVEVVYEDGQLTYGATRGNGETGEDISENLKTIRSLPLRLRRGMNMPSFLSVRGEVFISRKGFHLMNRRRLEKGDDPFANPRNAAAGMMRQLDAKKVAGKPLDIYFYEVLRIEGRQFSAHWEELKQFDNWGLKTVPLNRKVSALKGIKKYHEHLMNNREGLDYEIDGVVIKVNDYAVRERLGCRERSPRWAIAWKFPPKEDVTRVADITVQVGRTGMLTPIALLDPVDVGGVTVSRATLHNEEEVHRKDIRINDKVRIIRAGDVIPEVKTRLKEPGKRRKKKFTMPRTCPSCSSVTYREGAYYFCGNTLSCPAQLIGKIVHYASREAMNIEHLGEKTARQLVERDMIKDIAGIYDLSVKDLKQLDGFAKKSAEELFYSIQNSRKATLDRFLFSLGIRHIGRHVASVLAQKYRKLESIKNAKLNELKGTDQIGPEIASSIRRFFEKTENKTTLKKLFEAGIEMQNMPQQKEKRSMSGKTFVFTGTLRGYKRNEAKNLVEDLGGRSSSSVSSETDYVVVGKNPGSKLEEAKKMDIKTLDESDFRMLMVDDNA
ncbi:MAG: NAD-dependent DNA ligase LigA [Nitrospirota bacterium]